MNLYDTLATNIAPIPLPYAMNALSPTLGEETIRLHYGLYQNYAKNYDSALGAVQAAQSETEMREALGAAAFQGSGYVLHSVYFTNMSPTPTEMGSCVAQAIAQAFGAPDTLRRQFQLAALSLAGPGWVVLGWHPQIKQLVLTGLSLHQNNDSIAEIPILALDTWEHAYYLDYKTDKARYFAAWWNLINWQDVESRLVMAMDETMPCS